MSEYPKWRYKNGASKLVNNAEEEKALGGGWKDNPGPQVAKAEELAAEKEKADADAKAKADKAAADQKAKDDAAKA